MQINQKAAESLADPEEYPNLFEDCQLALGVESKFAETRLYVNLQKIYQAKAESDMLLVEQRVRDILKKIDRDTNSISKTKIKSFCKNARKLAEEREYASELFSHKRPTSSWSPLKLKVKLANLTFRECYSSKFSNDDDAENSSVDANDVQIYIMNWMCIYFNGDSEENMLLHIDEELGNVGYAEEAFRSP
ncbi:hypothetical protein AgCh_008735 [Apium graveolens]